MFPQMIAALVAVISIATATECGDQYDIVNTFISTGGPGFGYGAINPAAQYPLSPLRVGPDTMSSVIDINYQHFSGYLYYDTIMRGFSHTHVVGAGAVDLGNIALMPYHPGQRQASSIANDRNGNNSDISNRKFWWSNFDKERETGSPGTYSVFLTEPQVQVNLLAVGTHAAVHKYTWKQDALDSLAMSAKNSANPDSSANNVKPSLTSFTPSPIGPAFVLDMCHSARMQESVVPMNPSRCVNASVTIDVENPNRFTGEVYFAGSLSGWTTYYVYGEISSNLPGFGVLEWNTCKAFRKMDAGQEGEEGDACVAGVNEVKSDTGVLFTLFSLGRRPQDGSSHRPQESLVLPTGASGLEVEVRVGLSWISTSQAEINMKDATTTTVDTVTTPLDYESLRARTRSTWCDVLSFFDVTPNDEDTDMQTMLYSAAYRTLLSPSRYNEVGGVYLGAEQDVIHNVTAERIAAYGEAGGMTAPLSYEFFSDLSTWDTFRTQHPWLLLVNEDLAVGIARSTADITAQMGAFPRWMMGNREAGCMIGEHGSAIIVEAVKAGLGAQIDVLGIQKALLLQSTQVVPRNGRNDVEHYMSAGYVSSESDDTATTATLSYAYDDFVLAELCAITGDTQCAKEALIRSKNYLHIWSPVRQFFCPKNIAGELDCPISPLGKRSWDAYKEGNALHYMWYPGMHDPAGLVSLFNSSEAFDATLNEFFENHLNFPIAEGMPRSMLPNPYFWMGNEHQFHIPFLFNHGPNCTRTQYWSRKITHMHYAAASYGSPGNDDYGSMSSWLLFASLGVFPQAGTSNFWIGSPRVQKATINMRHFDGSRSVLSIQTENNSAENVFVKSLLVNGVEHTSPFIDRSVLAAPNGCTLQFLMQSEPSSGLCAI